MTKNRAAKWIKRTLAALAILLILFFLGVVPFALSRLLIKSNFRFPDPDFGKTPASYGVAYDDVEFESDPGIRIRGWYVPAQTAGTEMDTRGTVILVHGLNRTRAEMLTRAIFLAQSGYNALLFDLRHHGESDGEISSLGYYESNDIVAAIYYLADDKGITGKLALWGVSMGASAALLAYARSPEIVAAIADSSFLSFEDTVVHHARLVLSLPRFPIVDEILWLTTWQLGFRKEDFDLRKTVRQIGSRPILFVAGGEDPRMPPEIAKTLYQVSPSPQKEILIIAGAGHGSCYRTGTAGYQTVVLSFLRKNMTSLVSDGKSALN